MSRCSDCGYEHRHPADREACAALHGRIRRPWDHRDPYALCELCGYAGHFSEMLDHLHQYHRHDVIRTGHLVRPIIDADDIARYEP